MEQLKKRLFKGETESFVELYDLLGERLSRYLSAKLNSQDSFDVMQEVFVRLVRHHRRLGKSKNLEAYVFLVARNESNRWRRKHHRQPATLAEEIPLTTFDSQISVESQLEQTEYAHQLLDQLDADSREVVELKIFSELTFAEIAQILKQPAATVASRYRRAILKLKTLVTTPMTDSASSTSLPAN